MRREIISIVTGWDPGLGAGHIQRMAALSDYIDREKNTRSFIIADQGAESLPAGILCKVLPYIQSGSSFIIRDKRDSTVEEMLSLKRYCRVITIDDCGPGREFADLAIDLLPNLKYSVHSKKLFIYGYNFTESIRLLGDRQIKKTIDCAIYTGYNPSRETVEFLLSLVPPHATCALLSGEKSLICKEGLSSQLTMSYAEAILSSRVLISHFGITLYEGLIAGCRLVSLNPTEYHSQLSDSATDELGLINLGTREEIEAGHACEVISKLIGNPVSEKIDPPLVLAHIEKKLEQFYHQIAPFLRDFWSVKK